MTRYYFDIIENGIIEVDETGAEFPDLSAAVAEARRTIMEMLDRLRIPSEFVRG